MDFDRKNSVLITCARDLVEYLAQEVRALHFSIETTHSTGLALKASFYDCLKLNLWLRTAFSVLYLLKEFKAQSPYQLYDNVFRYPWEDLISADEYISVVSRIDTKVVNNSMFASQKVKDAIVDRILKKSGQRPDSGSTRDNVVVNLYWKDHDCWLYLNTSGRKLSDRGYRKIPGKAPLQETLAAGIIMAAGFTGDAPLVIPMAGSGSLAVEACLLALNKAPGLLRSNFGFMHIKDFEHDKWFKLRKEVLAQTKKKLDYPVIASDIDQKAIEAAQKNAQTAGVGHFIEFHSCGLVDTPIPKAKGIIVLNPPYGKRLGELKDLERLYSFIGDFFKQKCPGYTAYVFTGNLELAKKVGLRASSRIPFYNADIECRLLRYDMYEGSRK
ncbi:MAG: class I SAM-dependent RNA methyltransferase [Candidatus Omnitrophica bacterium]|nr:class I SAM-dependent RNA methyltransferase [Candidatus Omnitrophota bacterium]